MSEGMEATSEATEVTETNTDAALAHDGELTTEANTNKDVETSSESVGADGEYTPNYKFKVMDQEYEMDEFVRNNIKDPETERKARELYEKAYGLDHVKPKYQEVQKRFKTLEQTHTQLTSQISDLQEDYSRGDFDSFFKKLDIPQEKVLQWVLEKARYQQMSPEQRQLLDSRKQAEQRAFELERQQKQSEQFYQSEVTKAKTYAMNTALERPDIKPYVQAYDARVGRPGAFRDEVINRGVLHWHTHQVDITPEQAIQEVIQFAGVAPQMSPQPGGQNGMGQQQAQPTQKAPAQRPAGIPNVSGRQASPMKAKYTSVDQLKQKYDEMRNS